MKTIFFLFVLATTVTLHCSATDVIYDSAGNKLVKGIPYYILPLLRGTGGGLTISQNTKNACPANVTQESYQINKGIPFTFNPIVLEEEFIRRSYPTSIEADVSDPCHGSSIWKVSTSEPAKDDDDDELLTNSNHHKFARTLGLSSKDHKKKDHDHDHKKKKDDHKEVPSVRIVTTGGEFNKPESCFQIVEDGMMPGLQSYQIQHCPFKCGTSTSNLTCYNVGLISDADGKQYLAPTDALFPVVFTSSLARPSTFDQLSAKVTTVSQSVIQGRRSGK